MKIKIKSTAGGSFSGLLRLCLLTVLALPLVFSACGTSPAAGGASSADAQASAQAALDRMDGKQPAVQSPAQPATQGASSTQQGAVVNNSKSKPAWVDSVDSVYSRAQYIAAVGYAANRAMAEKNAFANLIAIFGQSIQADQTITNTYQEAVRNGVTAGWTDTIDMENTIRIAASMDTLVGAEIKEVWFDSKSTYYAAAVMEKARTVQLYNDMIKANQNMINNLITMNQTEKNSLEGFSRYQFAAATADINISYGNVLKVIGAVPPDGLVKGDDYRIEAQNITKAIPVSITVKNDKSGRIQGAFAKALSDLGFKSGGTNSRYVLAVDIITTPVELEKQVNKFTRIEMAANLNDTSINAVLFPFNFNSREGHTTQSEADNRAYTAAERKINEDYKKLLNDYLSQLLPSKK